MILLCSAECPTHQAFDGVANVPKLRSCLITTGTRMVWKVEIQNVNRVRRQPRNGVETTLSNTMKGAVEIDCETSSRHAGKEGMNVVAKDAGAIQH